MDSDSDSEGDSNRKVPVQYLVYSVVQNDIDFFKEISDTSNWYNFINPDDGNSLLQLAIIHKARDVCDYFLTLPKFPFDNVNHDGKTALEICLDTYNDNFKETVACELVRRGCRSNLLLHHAIEVSFVKLTKLLLELGFDPNEEDEGVSALWICLDSDLVDTHETELATALLCYGADPTIRHCFGYSMFEYAVRFCSYTLEEAFFYYIFDQYFCTDTHFEVFMKMADERSPFFRDVVKCTRSIVLGKTSLNYYHFLFFIDVEYLRMLLDQFGDVIRTVLAQIKPSNYSVTSFCEKMSLRNVDLLLSRLKQETIDFIVNFSDKFYFNFLVGFGSDESIMVETLSYLLSYGLRLNESNLSAFYKRYGYNKLLKLILLMEIDNTRRIPLEPFLSLIYDVTMDLDKSDPQLMNYFACPKQAQVPLLVELSRNVFRKHLITMFNIQTARHFYTIVNALPIGLVHKKIITFEKKLY